MKQRQYLSYGKVRTLTTAGPGYLRRQALPARAGAQALVLGKEEEAELAYLQFVPARQSAWCRYARRLR